MEPLRINLSALLTVPRTKFKLPQSAAHRGIWPLPAAPGSRWPLLQAPTLPQAGPTLLSLVISVPLISALPGALASAAAPPPTPFTSPGLLVIFQFPAQRSLAQRSLPRPFGLGQLS